MPRAARRRGSIGPCSVSGNPAKSPGLMAHTPSGCRCRPASSRVVPARRQTDEDQPAPVRVAQGRGHVDQVVDGLGRLRHIPRQPGPTEGFADPVEVDPHGADARLGELTGEFHPLAAGTGVVQRSGGQEHHGREHGTIAPLRFGAHGEEPVGSESERPFGHRGPTGGPVHAGGGQAVAAHGEPLVTRPPGGPGDDGGHGLGGEYQGVRVGLHEPGQPLHLLPLGRRSLEQGPGRPGGGRTGPGEHQGGHARSVGTGHEGQLPEVGRSLGRVREGRPDDGAVARLWRPVGGGQQRRLPPEEVTSRGARVPQQEPVDRGPLGDRFVGQERPHPHADEHDRTRGPLAGEVDGPPDVGDPGGHPVRLVPGTGGVSGTGVVEPQRGDAADGES